MLDVDVIKEQFLNKAVVWNSYIKTCFCTLFITEQYFIEILFV